MIDLHIHSNASDGDYNPTQLVEKAASLGINVIALTDHDTVSGLEEAQSMARNCGIRLIPGVELEIQIKAGNNSPIFCNKEGNNKNSPGIPSGEFHLLGLGIKTITSEFLSALKYLAGARERRNLGIVEKILAAGIDIDYETIKSYAGDIVGRPHFGAFLINRKIAKNHEQAFKRWLGKERPFYVPKEGLEFARAVELIHQCGGKAVLAHPMSLYVSWGRMPGLLAVLKENGLDGIEAWHPTARVSDCMRLEKLGNSLGLFISAGSDFHGSVQPNRKLGYTAGDRKISDESLPEFLKEF